MKLAIGFLALLMTGTCTIEKDGSVTLPDLTCDQPYSVQLSTSYNYSNIPPGLTLNPTTGLLSGTVKCTDLPDNAGADGQSTFLLYYTPKGR